MYICITYYTYSVAARTDQSPSHPRHDYDSHRNSRHTAASRCNEHRPTSLYSQQQLSISHRLHCPLDSLSPYRELFAFRTSHATGAEPSFQETCHPAGTHHIPAAVRLCRCIYDTTSTYHIANDTGRCIYIHCYIAHHHTPVDSRTGTVRQGRQGWLEDAEATGSSEGRLSVERCRRTGIHLRLAHVVTACCRSIVQHTISDTTITCDTHIYNNVRYNTAAGGSSHRPVTGEPLGYHPREGRKKVWQVKAGKGPPTQSVV